MARETGCILAGAHDARLGRPVVWLLSGSTNAVLRLLGIQGGPKAAEVLAGEGLDVGGGQQADSFAVVARAPQLAFGVA